MKTIVFFILFFTLALSLHAQLLPSRNMLITPLADTGNVSGVLARSHFFGEGMRGFGSAGDDRAWDATIGGFADLYRWSDGPALRARFAQDMLANSLTSDIHFKPRSMQYEENLSLVVPEQNFDWEAGLTYRCKHDIDNTDLPTSSVTPGIDSIPQKRVIILGGLYGVYEVHPHLVFAPPFEIPNLLVSGVIRADYYLIHEDNRFPYNTIGDSWANARASLFYLVRFDYDLNSTCSVYGSYSLTYLIILHGSNDGNNREELGFHLNGVFGGLDFFVSNEYLFDDLSTPIPRSTNVWSVGMRVN